MNNHQYNYESYILNENNMRNYLKYKLNIQKKITIPKQIHVKSLDINVTAHKNKDTLLIPKEQDTLFWCYYIILNGEDNYEILNNKNSLIAKQIKIDYVSKIRDNKQIIKTYKFDTLNNIENNLVHDNNINIKTVMSLCSINKINLIFVRRNTFFELLMNDHGPIYIIREQDFQSNYNKKYGFEIANDSSLEKIRTTLYKIENLDKPIKALSSYKVKDLTDICLKLGIEITKNETGKYKTKNELYESIIQYF